MSNDLLIILESRRRPPSHRPWAPGGDLAQAVEPRALDRGSASRPASSWAPSLFGYAHLHGTCSLPLAVAGFLLGLGLVYILDLYSTAGKWPGRRRIKGRVDQLHRRRKPRGAMSRCSPAAECGRADRRHDDRRRRTFEPKSGAYRGLAILHRGNFSGRNEHRANWDARGREREREAPDMGWTSLIGPLAFSCPPLQGGFLRKPGPAGHRFSLRDGSGAGCST